MTNIVQTKDGDREVKGVNGADDLLSDEPQPRRANEVAGEVSFIDHLGRTHVLRPTFQALQEIESALGIGVDALRTKFTLAGMPVAGMQPQAPTTHEYGVVIAAGIRATGEPRVDVAKATQLAFQTGRAKLRRAMVDFTWSLCNGGRGREEDLEKRGSSQGSTDADLETVQSLIQDLGRRGEDSSG